MSGEHAPCANIDIVAHCCAYKHQSKVAHLGPPIKSRRNERRTKSFVGLSFPPRSFAPSAVTFSCATILEIYHALKRNSLEEIFRWYYIIYRIRLNSYQMNLDYNLKQIWWPNEGVFCILFISKCSHRFGFVCDAYSFLSFRNPGRICSKATTGRIPGWA